MAEIPRACPGQIGPDDIAAWRLALDFPKGDETTLNGNNLGRSQKRVTEKLLEQRMDIRV